MLKQPKNFVFIDFANLIKGVEALGWKIDLAKFYVFLTEKYSAEKIVIFTGYLPYNTDSYGYLKSTGYDIYFKEVIWTGRKIKANCDAEMILEMARFFYEKMKEHQKIVIISSDGDFACIVRFFQERGALDRVISPCKEKCSVLLKIDAQRIVYLEEFRHILENKKAPGEDGTSQGSLSW